MANIHAPVHNMGREYHYYSHSQLPSSCSYEETFPMRVKGQTGGAERKPVSTML